MVYKIFYLIVLEIYRLCRRILTCAVDKGADIWAFDGILYECLKCKRAFEGETVTETPASALTKEPEWEKIPANVAPLRRRCLEKDTRRRLRDMGESMAWIESTPESSPVKRPWFVWGVAAIFAPAPEGKHFLLVRPVSESSPFIVVLNWISLLRE
jgi:hypothetical protein